MIGKVSRSKSFRSAIEYIFSKEGASVVFSNMRETLKATFDLEGLINAFEHHAGLHDRTKQPVYKIVLSPAIGDRLTPWDWSNLCQNLIDCLGLTYHQTVAVLHTDTNFPNSDRKRNHVHIIANLVSDEGKCADLFLGLQTN